MCMVKELRHFNGFEILHLASEENRRLWYITVNFAKYSVDEVYDALYPANLRLIRWHKEVLMRSYEKTYANLYYHYDATFKGFRQT